MDVVQENNLESSMSFWVARGAMHSEPRAARTTVWACGEVGRAEPRPNSSFQPQISTAISHEVRRRQPSRLAPAQHGRRGELDAVRDPADPE